jgi:DNA-binding transcriptional LysR family regulator
MMTRVPRTARLRINNPDRMTEFRTLSYFVATCRAGSLALAADELGIAASTLSTTMKTLEQDLGLELFRRINNGLYPTEAARTLMRAADSLLMAEMFAHRWVASPPKAQLEVLKVDIGLSFTIGGISKALRRAIDSMGADRPDVLIDPVWTDEKDVPHVSGLADDWNGTERSLVTIGLGEGNLRGSQRAVTLLTDPWVFACRLPAGTRQLPSAAECSGGYADQAAGDEGRRACGESERNNDGVSASPENGAYRQGRVPCRTAKDQSPADSLFQHGASPPAGFCSSARRQHEPASAERTNSQTGSFGRR